MNEFFFKFATKTFEDNCLQKLTSFDCHGNCRKTTLSMTKKEQKQSLLF
jgi:hypothetical protein